MWRDSGTVGPRMAWKRSTLPCASSPSAALAAGAMASKMPSSASLLPCVGSLPKPSPAISSA
jgi:hypothetical protein